MACKTETKEIDGVEYSVTQWPAETALLNKMKLIKIFGASLGLLISGLDMAKDAEIDLSDVDFSGAIAKIFESTDPEELVSILKSCIVGVACNDKRITNSSFTELFSGDSLSSVYKIFIFVIQVNYSNLLPSQLIAKMLAKAKKSMEVNTQE